MLRETASIILLARFLPPFLPVASNVRGNSYRVTSPVGPKVSGDDCKGYYGGREQAGCWGAVRKASPSVRTPMSKLDLRLAIATASAKPTHEKQMVVALQ